jgi:hypothetical protein
VLHCVTLCYIVLHCVTLCYIVLHCVTLCCCVTLCYIVLRCVTLCCIVLHCVALCYIVLRCVTLCYIVLRCVTLCYIVLQTPAPRSFFSVLLEPSPSSHVRERGRRRQSHTTRVGQNRVYTPYMNTYLVYVWPRIPRYTVYTVHIHIWFWPTLQMARV